MTLYLFPTNQTSPPAFFSTSNSSSWASRRLDCLPLAANLQLAGRFIHSLKLRASHLPVVLPLTRPLGFRTCRLLKIVPHALSKFLQALRNLLSTLNSSTTGTIVLPPTHSSFPLALWYLSR